MIHITPSATKKIKQLKEEEGSSADTFLRVRIEKGGCSGMSYKMDFDKEVNKGDQSFENQGEKVVIDPESYLYLIGLTLDYEGGLNGKGFVFNNPNAKKACGCGISFNV